MPLYSPGGSERPPTPDPTLHTRYHPSRSGSAQPRRRQIHLSDPPGRGEFCASSRRLSRAASFRHRDRLRVWFGGVPRVNLRVLSRAVSTLGRTGAMRVVFAFGGAWGRRARAEECVVALPGCGRGMITDLRAETQTGWGGSARRLLNDRGEVNFTSRVVWSGGAGRGSCDRSPRSPLCGHSGRDNVLSFIMTHDF
jgi:hypothetical protein